jgi:clan AA aspartic protease (TIGR02281 family)
MAAPGLPHERSGYAAPKRVFPALLTIPHAQTHRRRRGSNVFEPKRTRRVTLLTMRLAGVSWAALASVVVSLLPTKSALSQTQLLEARDGAFRTNIILNEALEAPAMIDTGSSSLAICAPLALELHLSLGEPVELETSNGRILAHRVQLGSMRIGRIILRDVAAVIHPPTSSCTEVLVGLSVLKMLRTMILRGNNLKLVGGKSEPSGKRLRRARSSKS